MVDEPVDGGDGDGLIREVHVGFRKGDETLLREQIQALIADS